MIAADRKREGKDTKNDRGRSTNYQNVDTTQKNESKGIIQRKFFL